jgi:deazaflavin-dependent oxidoreductase (nitroreductase family)
MQMRQATLDRIRLLNKHVTNKILIRISGKQFSHFAILSHTGRNSGNLYRIPIIAEPLRNGFVIALTYGKKVDWYENVMAKGGCSLRWKNREYVLINPEIIDREIAVAAFPSLLRWALKRMGIHYYLRLAIQPSPAPQRLGEASVLP